MKKFSKLLAVLVALAVIICPMTSAIVANATANGGTYSIVAEDANNVVLTIGSNDGFIVYQATVTFNNDSAFQNSYSSEGYTNGLKVIDYSLVSGSKDNYNAPAISAQQNGASLVILVSATDAATLDLYSEVQIGIRVASGSTANLTKIQAADEGTIEEDPSLLNFGAKVASDGTVDTENNDDATTGIAHTHNYTKTTPYEVSAPTCTTYGVYRKTCETCGAVDPSGTYTGTVMADHTPSNVQNATADFLKHAATCTEPAVYYYECTVCHAAIEEDMAGYTGTFTSGSSLGHDMTMHSANAATCTTAGNSLYYSCGRCNKYFSDAAGNTEIAANSWNLAATGHTPVTDAAVAATCTSTGLTEGSHCSVCNAVITAQTETPIDPTNHTNIVNDAAVAATCTETGLTAGSHCAACDTVIVAQETVNALGHNYTYTDHGDGTHDIGCTRCDYAANEACVDTNDDGYCDLCNAQLACEHNYVGVVTTQPTKNATGVMTYTCSLCGDSYTEPIAIPTVTSAVTFSHALNVSAVVADQITVSTKQMRTNFGEGATYFIDVAYETYSSTSDLYNLTNAHTVLTSANRETSTGTSTANKDIIFFKKMALYEMTLDFDMTLYIKNEAGVVVAYSSYESSIADMALALATQYPSNTNLLTCLADMCNYGKAAQEFFAAANPTKDIVSAVDPTVVLGDYMVNASDISILPGAGEYDNTKVQNNKIDSSTGFISANMTLNIASSNRIQYTLRADGYDLADCEIVMSYTSLYGAKEVNVDMSELTPNGLTGAGKQKYLYQFGDLPIYDVNAVVTMSMYHNGVLEMTSQYSVGNFVNTYVEAASDLGTVMRTMELFANSTAIQLGQGSIF